jgi:hypothetical protein
MHPLLQQLRGGDLRSIGRSNAVVHEVLAHPELMTALLAGISNTDPLVRMRSADAFEKVTAFRPELAQWSAQQVLALLTRPQPKEVLWHLLQIAPRVQWLPRQLQAVLQAVKAAHKNDSSIVKASALQAAVELLPQAPSGRASVSRRLRAAEASSVPALAARARKLRRRSHREA